MSLQSFRPQPAQYYSAPDETRLRLLRARARRQLTLIIITGLLAGMALGAGTYLLHKNWNNIFGGC